ncbi:MAG: hypothetical protein U5J98_03580 [Halobacteriales archaeon]|nr:hypothetical protein [Halobacteriales archaeon]
MGLRCLIGHDYGQPQTSRDRRERGNEVVTTVTEYRECTRCGHTRVISENKEVTAGGAEPAADASAEWASEEPGDPDQSTVEAFSAPDAGSAEHEEPMTAADDDGVILEDEPEPAAPRGHGEWPEADLGEAPEGADEEPEPWPDEESAPDPTTTEPAEPEPPDAGEDPLDVGPEPSADAAADDDPEQTEIMTDGPDDGPAEPAEPAASSEPDESPPPRPDNRNTEFVCPDCGESWPTRNASLRPGDICPECRIGYLDERVVQ